jgi:hypothetical protein
MCSKHTAVSREEYHSRFLTGEDGFTGRIPPRVGLNDFPVHYLVAGAMLKPGFATIADIGQNLKFADGFDAQRSSDDAVARSMVPEALNARSVEARRSSWPSGREPAME